jgi:nifR3 family TIM-barrel protein
MQIGKFTFNEPVFLAPMAGVTDTAYRIIAHDMGCPLCYAEMVSSQGIHFRNERTLTMLESEPGERPLAMQIFANTPEMAAEAAKYVEDLGTADILDFNMGCPAPKIVKNGEGSALMRDPDKAYAILSAIRKAVKMPFTVKMRKGWDDDHVNVLEIAKIAEAAGVDAIAVHGRTREQFYSGKADWDIIAEVKKTVKVPVIANGDVRTCQDLQKILDVTGADGVMIGRGAQGNPWLFREVKAAMEGKSCPEVTGRERIEMALRHLDLEVQLHGERGGVLEMRKHISWYVAGMRGSAQFRQKVTMLEGVENVKNALLEFQKESEE